MSKTHQIQLDDKQLYLVWSIVCWFNKPVTSKLKYKLAGMADSPLRSGLSDRYDKRIEDQIIELGAWLQAKRQREDDPTTQTGDDR